MKQHVNMKRGNEYLQGEIIFKQNEETKHFYVIESGIVARCFFYNDKEVIVDNLIRGDFFGEECLIDKSTELFVIEDDLGNDLGNESKIICYKAITAVKITFVNINDFKSVIENSHPLSNKFIYLILKNLKKYSEHKIKQITRSNLPNNNLSTKEHTSSIGSVNNVYITAVLLDLNFKLTAINGIPEAQFIRQITSILNILPHQVKDILEMFHGYNLIKRETIKKQGRLSSFMTDGDNYLHNISNDLLKATKFIIDSKKDQQSSLDLQLMEIEDALELYDIDRNKFYSKMTKSDLPDHLFFINKPVLLELIKNKGKEFFEKPSAKNATDIKDLDDLVFVDKKTIKLVLQNIESYDVAQLVKIASAEIKEKIMESYSQRMKDVIEYTAKQISKIDDLEIQELEKKFIESIKIIQKSSSHSA